MNYTTQPDPGGVGCNQGDLCIRIPGGGDLHQSIPDPTGVARALQRMFAVANLGVPSRGQQQSEGKCDVFIGVVTTAPAHGFGSGKVERVKFNSDGSWSRAGGTVTVVFPHI